MPSGRSRRRLLGVGLGGLVAFASGGFAWNQYARRNHLTLRLHAVNEADGPVTLELVGGSDLDDGYETSVDLEPAGDEGERDRKHVPGPWIKRAEPYSVRARTDEAELVLENDDINDRLDSGWGSDEARVTIVVASDGSLETEVESRE